MERGSTTPDSQRFKPDTELLPVPGSPEIREIRVNDHLVNLPRNQFLVYSPIALEKLGIIPSLFAGRSTSDKETGIALSDLQKVRMPETCEEITVFGTGRAIDIGKYLAYMHGKKLNIIPSLLSTNALGTPFGCYEEFVGDSTKTTLTTGYAHSIFVDFAFLKTDEVKNLYGLADVLSITTALHDWDLAIMQNPSVKDKAIYEKANAMAESCFKHIAEKKLDVRAIFNLIVNAAYITGLYGNGRPESGSEHIFSKFMELDASRKGTVVMHGQSVGLGLLLMSTLQGNKRREQIFDAVRRLGLLSEFKDRKEELKRTIVEILPQLEPHPIRYSVINVELNNLKDPDFCAYLADDVVEELFAPASN